MWTQNICSVFAFKVAFSNLSGIVWTRPQIPSVIRTFFDERVEAENIQRSKNMLLKNILKLGICRTYFFVPIVEKIH